MKTTRKNPLGYPVPEGTVVARVGSGVHTHVYHPQKKQVICRSGHNAGKKGKTVDKRGKAQIYYRSNAQMVTCYRCQKLVRLNLKEGRLAWVGND